MIVIGGAAARNRVRENVAAVLLECRTGFSSAVSGGKVADSKQTTTKVREEIDIQVSVIAFAES